MLCSHHISSHQISKNYLRVQQKTRPQRRIPFSLNRFFVLFPTISSIITYFVLYIPPHIHPSIENNNTQWIGDLTTSLPEVVHVQPTDMQGGSIRTEKKTGCRYGMWRQRRQLSLCWTWLKASVSWMWWHLMVRLPDVS